MDTSTLMPQETRSNVLDYLSEGALVTSSRTLLPDRFDASAHSIPLLYLTDGEWVWSNEVVAYVKRYGYAIPADFLSHIQEFGYHMPDVDEKCIADARSELQTESK